MEADLLHQRLTEAVQSRRGVTLLLRGAHRISIADASLSSSEAAGEARFDITGKIGINALAPSRGTVSVTSGDVASIFVESN